MRLHTVVCVQEMRFRLGFRQQPCVCGQINEVADGNSPVPRNMSRELPVAPRSILERAEAIAFRGGFVLLREANSV